MTATSNPQRRRQASADLLRSHGLRATQQRMLVLGALSSRVGDVTAQTLHEELRAQHPSLGLATVYRTLGALVEAGVVDALQHGHGTCYRRCAPGHHHHLTCVSCRGVVELHQCDVAGWADQVAEQHGFTGVTHVVELAGTCAECRAASE